MTTLPLTTLIKNQLVQEGLKPNHYVPEVFPNVIWVQHKGVDYHIIVDKTPIEKATEPGAKWQEPATP